MAKNNTSRIVAIVLIIIGIILDLSVLGMWLMPSMMSGMMGGRMIGSMVGCAMCMFVPLLLSTVLVALGVVLLRTNRE
jgi:hypothetical protein